MIKVLIVDDSAVARQLLRAVIEADPGFQVVGAVEDGEKALGAVQQLQPDVVTMDINMPHLNGFEVTRRIMESCPTPIVIVTGSWDVDAVSTSFHTLEAGALAVLARPPGIGHPDHEAASQELIRTLRAMSEVKVIRRWARARAGAVSPVPLPGEAPPRPKPGYELVAVGASTGGPQALQALLAALPQAFRLPVLMVQHMAEGFIHGFAKWLSDSTGRPVQVAGHAEPLMPGHAYLAPDGHFMGVTRNGRITLVRGRPDNGLCPSAAFLFRSATEAYGERAIGVLLTGMGKDGAEELKLMKDGGAVTFAQDQDSALIYGMPAEAVRIGGAVYQLPPERIAAALVTLTHGG